MGKKIKPPAQQHYIAFEGIIPVEQEPTKEDALAVEDLLADAVGLSVDKLETPHDAAFRMTRSRENEEGLVKKKVRQHDTRVVRSTTWFNGQEIEVRQVFLRGPSTTP